jgi:Tfp pilus assembly protein PilN
MLRAIGIAALLGIVLGGAVIWGVRGREIAGLEEQLAATRERLAGYVTANEDVRRANARMDVQIDALVTDRRDARAEAAELRQALDAQAGDYQREIARILERGRDEKADPADIARDGFKRLRCLRAAATAAAC